MSKPFQDCTCPLSAGVETPKIKRAKVFIVDDYPTIAEFLRLLIGWQTDLEVCGDAPNGHDALRFLSIYVPDLVLLDLTLPDCHGLELIKDIHVIHPTIRILVFSGHDETMFAERALQAGALGYVMKSETSGTWLKAMRLVATGCAYLSPTMMARMKQQAAASMPRIRIGSLEELSDRELEVLQLLGQGQSVGQVAATLCLGRHTVETYQTRVRDKLRLKTTHELMRYAVSWCATGTAPQARERLS